MAMAISLTLHSREKHMHDPQHNRDRRCLKMARCGMVVAVAAVVVVHQRIAETSLQLPNPG